MKIKKLSKARGLHLDAALAIACCCCCCCCNCNGSSAPVTERA